MKTINDRLLIEDTKTDKITWSRMLVSEIKCSFGKMVWMRGQGSIYGFSQNTMKSHVNNYNFSYINIACNVSFNTFCLSSFIIVFFFILNNVSGILLKHIFSVHQPLLPRRGRHIIPQEEGRISGSPPVVRKTGRRTLSLCSPQDRDSIHKSVLAWQDDQRIPHR